MTRRVVLRWNEEFARVWWKWGREGSAAPYPGKRRAWFAFLREWIFDTVSTFRVVCSRRGESEASPLPQYLRIIVLALPPAPHVRTSHALHGAASILAPPARPRGAGHIAAVGTT